MILIDEIGVNNSSFKFYDGVDFDILIKHSKDGSDGFIFCFIDNWIKEVKSYNRQRKLNSIVDNIKYINFEWEMIDNNYISIYQVEGTGIEPVLEAVKNKVSKNSEKRSKPIYVYDKNFNLLNLFSSTKEAAINLNISVFRIRKFLKNKKTCNNLYFMHEKIKESEVSHAS